MFIELRMPEEPWSWPGWFLGRRVFAQTAGVGVGARAGTAEIVLEAVPEEPAEPPVLALAVRESDPEDAVFVGEVVETQAPRRERKPRPRPPVVVGECPSTPVAVEVPRIAPNQKLPKGVAVVMHTDGPYDYVGQDGRFCLVDTKAGRTMPGWYDREREAFEAAERLNDSYWLAHGRPDYKPRKFSRRLTKATRALTLHATPWSNVRRGEAT